MFLNKYLLSASLVLVSFASVPAPAADNSTAASAPSTQAAHDLRLRIGRGDYIAGKAKAEMCASCHGADGNSIDPQIPKLAGQYGDYISKQMRNYLASTRTHQVMSGMAATINDDDLADISAYFAAQPMMKGDHASTNQLGKQLYENDDLSKMRMRCSSCHGVDGKGLDASNPLFPVIGGQHKEYLLTQMKNFRNGVRNNSDGGVMNITVHRLSDAELEALAEYISGL